MEAGARGCGERASTMVLDRDRLSPFPMRINASKLGQALGEGELRRDRSCFIDALSASNESAAVIAAPPLPVTIMTVPVLTEVGKECDSRTAIVGLAAVVAGTEPIRIGWSCDVAG